MATSPSQLVFTPNVLHNQSLTSIKFLSASFAGAVAGILGLENWHGFALFAASVLFTSFMIYAINCKGKPSKYLVGGIGELVNPGQDNMFTFILVWTLFYGIVHGMRQLEIQGLANLVCQCMTDTYDGVSWRLRAVDYIS